VIDRGRGRQRAPEALEGERLLVRRRVTRRPAVQHVFEEMADAVFGGALVARADPHVYDDGGDVSVWNGNQHEARSAA
jgi:hypothetical protein